MRNSSLVKRSCAENVTGLSIVPKPRTLDSPAGLFGVVGERSVGETRVIERTPVAYRSENAGMSSEKHVRNMFPVNLRFPTEG